MDQTVLNNLLSALGGDTYTIVLKLALLLGGVLLWWYVSGKVKQAEVDAANQQSQQQQGQDQANTGKDTNDIAQSANDAANAIDDIHNRKP